MQSLLIRLFAIFSLLPSSLASQYYNYPIDHYSQYFLQQGDTSLNGAFRSLPETWYSLDSVWGYGSEKHYSVLSSKLYHDHLLSVETDDFQVYIDLLLHFQIGLDIRDTAAYSDTTFLNRNMRGFSVKGNIGKKVSFETTFRETQSSLPRYLYDYAIATKHIPGWGRAKDFNGLGFDHNIAEGYVSYSPSDQINIQFGSQRNFIGSGRRSMLLSDNAASYPQLKASMSFFQGKLQYHVIHAWLQTLERLPQGESPESLFKPKGGSFKYLEYRPSGALSIGLFEGFIWNRFDEEEGTLAFPPEAYNPILGLNSVALGLDDDYNGVLGLDVGVRPLKGLKIYGQYVWDSANRTAYQVGLRSNGLGLDGLQMSIEYNSSGDATYAFSSDNQGYTHFGQALSHPMGSAFQEARADLLYFYKRWFADISYVSASTSTLQDGTYAGQQLFEDLPEDGYELDGITLSQLDCRLGYFFNPKNNMNLYLGYTQRDETRMDVTAEQGVLLFGLEMSLLDRYEDF